MPSDLFTITPEQAGATLAAILRFHLPGQSWSQVRRLVETRRVKIGGEICVDSARRMREGAGVEILPRPAPRPRQREDIGLRYLDEQLVVVEKPAGMATVRHPLERAWPEGRKVLEPTLEDLVPRLIANEEGRTRKGVLPRVRKVHRLDKGTSGLVVFARTVTAERELGKQFRAHTVVRRYLAVVPGNVAPQRIASRLVRDRGDGRRGSTGLADLGKEAVTHVTVEERLPGYTLLSCRLETGRTHQIRIHLSELGHPICGETVYNRRLGEEPILDPSGALRLALHAVELGFVHPRSGETMHWAMPLPPDLSGFLERLRREPRDS